MKPYDKNQSFLNKVKNAVKGYFTPSWMQAALSPKKTLNEERLNLDPDKNGCSLDFKTGSTMFQAYNDENVVKKRLHSSSLCIADYGGAECMAESEPPSKKRAVEKNVEFIEEQTPMISSTPIHIPSHRPITTLNPPKNQSVIKSTPKTTSLFSMSHTSKQERSSLMSPFYSGPVAYGGANACQGQSQKSLNGHDDKQFLISKRQSNLGLSRTTQKILRVLERDQVHQVTKMNLPPLNYDMEKQKSLTMEVFNRDKKPVHGPPVKQMQTPSLVNIKPNYALTFNALNSKSNESKSMWTGKIRRDREKHHEFRGREGSTIKAANEGGTNCLADIKLPPMKMAPLSTSSIISSSFLLESNIYKFSSPRLSQERRLIADSVLLLNEKFMFSEPECRENMPVVESCAAIKTSLASFDVDINMAVRKPVISEGLANGPEKIMKIGSVMDVLKKDLLVSGSQNESCHDELPATSLKELFKASNNVWCCPTCMVSNKLQMHICPCCSTPKPSDDNPSKISVSVSNHVTEGGLMPKQSHFTSVLSTSSSGSFKESETPLPSLSVLFAPKIGEWSCALCMIKNNSRVDKCVACESPKPNSNAIQTSEKSLPSETNGTSFQTLDTVLPVTSSEPNTAPSLSEMFAAKPGEWNCSLCMVRNNGTVSKCVACESPKPAPKYPGKPLKDKIMLNPSQKTTPISSTRPELACGANMFASEASVGESKKDCVSTPASNILVNDLGGFSFGSMLPFKTSDFGTKTQGLTKQESGASGGFKPTVGSQDIMPSHSGFTGLGGGFHFTSRVSQSISSIGGTVNCVPASVAQSLPSRENITPHASISNAPHSTESNSNNSNSFSLANAKPVGSFCFGTPKVEASSSCVSQSLWSSVSACAYSAGGGGPSLLNSESGFSVKTQNDLHAKSAFGDLRSTNNFPSMFPSLSQTNILGNNIGTPFGTSSSITFSEPQKNFNTSFPQLSQINTAIISSSSTFGTKEYAGFHAFNTAGLPSSTNGDDMVMESPQPASNSFGFNKIAGFNFENSTNPVQHIMTSNPPSQGFPFSSVHSFNFNPVFTGTLQAQPPSNPQFNFGTTAVCSGNFTFSAGGAHAGRIIKKGTRRINKK